MRFREYPRWKKLLFNLVRRYGLDAMVYHIPVHVAIFEMYEMERALRKIGD